MNIKEEVWANTSKRQTLSIVSYIGSDKKRFKILVDLFLGIDKEIIQRSSWIYNYCIEAYPDLVSPYHALLIEKLISKQYNPIVSRSIMRSYQFAPIPSEIESLLFDLCIKYLNDPKKPVTLRVYSMATALRITEKHPELKPELIMVIEMGIGNGSPAYLAWSRKILKSLSLINQS